MAAGLRFFPVSPLSLLRFRDHEQQSAAQRRMVTLSGVREHMFDGREQGTGARSLRRRRPLQKRGGVRGPDGMAGTEEDIKRGRQV